MTRSPLLTRRRMFIALLALFLLIALPAILFVVNGIVLADGETTRVGTTSHPPATEAEEGPRQVKVLAYNIAKGFAHNGGLSFEKSAVVAARMEKIAGLIRAEAPDLVFLSEAIFECGPCPVNQVVTLAESAGMHAWAFGENYNIGLRFYRVVGGNAILSRRPLEPVANLSLAGRRPFYVTKNNRRALFCAVQLGRRRVLLASLHNDSFSITNNMRQMRQILEFVGDWPAILAGDFNARPDEKPIRVVRDCGHFIGAFEGPLTFPARAPEKRIDFIFAPKDWELVEHRVLESDLSDHRPVVSTFRLPSPERP